MNLIFVVITLASLNDLLTHLSIGGIKLSGIAWSFIFYLLICYLFLGSIKVRSIIAFKWFLVFSIYIILRAFQSESSLYAFIDIHYSLLIVVISVFSYHMVKNKDDAKKVENWILKSITIPLVIFILAFIPGNVEFSKFYGFRGLLGSRSVSLYSISIISLALSILFYENSKKKRRLAIFSIVIGILFIFITLSRTAFLDLMILFFLFTILKFSIRRFIIIVNIIFLILFFALSWSPYARRLFKEGGVLSEDGFSFSAYTSGRSLVWLETIKRGLENPLFGKGTGNIKIFMAQNFRQAGLLPHNEYIRIFYDGGIVGLMIILIAWIHRLRKHWFLWKKRDRDGDRDRAKFHLAAIMGTIGVLVSAIFDNVFLYIFMLTPIFLIYGICDKLEMLET